MSILIKYRLGYLTCHMVINNYLIQNIDYIDNGNIVSMKLSHIKPQKRFKLYRHSNIMGVTYIQISCRTPSRPLPDKNYITEKLRLLRK